VSNIVFPFLKHEIINTESAAQVVPVLEKSVNIPSRKIKKYGWHSDMPDHRDHMYAPLMAAKLQPKFDLRSSYTLPAVYDQGNIGSCTANAIAAAIQFDRYRQKLANSDDIPSRLFIYYNERKIEGTTTIDSGAQIRDGIKTVASQGDCFEAGDHSWPYDISKFDKQPPEDCYKYALTDRAVSYSRLNQQIDVMRSCLASGYPFIFGFTVFAEFESLEVEKSGIVNLPSSDSKPIGGHAVMAVGYDDAQQRLIIRNSWGVDWGQEGYFTMPYTYVTNPGLARDFWTIRIVSQ